MTDTPAQPDPETALRAAWRDFQRAPIGRLNVTRDALQAAARDCGWTWNEPLLAWVRTRLGEPRP